MGLVRKKRKEKFSVGTSILYNFYTLHFTTMLYNFYTLYFSDKSEKTIADINQYLYMYVNNLRSSMKLDDTEVKKLFKMVKDQYFDGKPVIEETLSNFSKLFSLIYFGIPALTMLKDRVKRTTAPNYFCVFSYVGNEKTTTDRLVKRQISGNCIFEVCYQ